MLRFVILTNFMFYPVEGGPAVRLGMPGDSKSVGLD